MFPNTAESLLTRLELQEANLPTYKSAVGATGQEITDVTEDRANLQYMLDYAALIEANKTAITKIKNAVYNGKPGEKIADFPVFPAGAAPFALRAGIEDRFNKRNARWKTAADYSEEIGIALGMVEASSNPVSPNSLIAALKLADLGNYQYEADFRKQGMDAMLVQYRVKGTEKWLEAKTCLSSPATITVPAPTVEGAAVQIEVRGRLLKGNQQIGQWSPIYPLTVNP